MELIYCSCYYTLLRVRHALYCTHCMHSTALYCTNILHYIDTWDRKTPVLSSIFKYSNGTFRFADSATPFLMGREVFLTCFMTCVCVCRARNPSVQSPWSADIYIYIYMCVCVCVCVCMCVYLFLPIVAKPRKNRAFVKNWGNEIQLSSV